MGSNRRYAEAIDRRMDARIVERIMRSGPPASLSDQELQLDQMPLTRDPRPSEVRAWVRYPEGPVEVTGLAVAWTSRAVAVRWRGPDNAEHRAWVWLGAVNRI